MIAVWLGAVSHGLSCEPVVLSQTASPIDLGPRGHGFLLHAIFDTSTVLFFAADSLVRPRERLSRGCGSGKCLCGP